MAERAFRVIGKRPASSALYVLHEGVWFPPQPGVTYKVARSLGQYRHVIGPMLLQELKFK